MAKVVIDPGHYKNCANIGANGYNEGNGMYTLSAYLYTELIRCGFTALLTREDDIANPSLTSRGKLANDADLFISEHSNAGGGLGVEVYYSIDLSIDKDFAMDLGQAVAKIIGTKMRGAKTKESPKQPGEDYYTVIDAAQDAGCKHVVLIENGFHDNVIEEAFLLSDSNLKLIAQAQAKVICDLFEVKYVEEKQEEHWAKKYYTYLIDNGIPIYEERFDDNMTRGEVFKLLAYIKGYEDTIKKD